MRTKFCISSEVAYVNAGRVEFGYVSGIKASRGAYGNETTYMVDGLSYHVELPESELLTDAEGREMLR